MPGVEKNGTTRRDFLKIVGVGGLGAASVYVIGCASSGATATETKTVTAPGGTTTPTRLGTPRYPAAKAYLVRDEVKCYACRSCMISCSIVNEGRASLSLGRRIVMHDSWIRGPDDVKHSQCQECGTPACVEVCPSGAAHVDTAHGNLRVVDRAICLAYQQKIAPDVCRLCVQNCHAVPSAAIWNPTVTTGGAKGVAMICDLCKSAPNWSGGGLDGKQACVEVCPMKAIMLIKTTPTTENDGNFNVNLRTANWDKNMDKPDRNAPYNLALTSPAIGETQKLRPSGGMKYTPADPVPPPYTAAVAAYPGPGPTP